MGGRAEVVVKSRQGDFPGAHTAADGRTALENTDPRPRRSQGDPGGQAVGPRSDDDGVILVLGQIATQVRALRWSLDQCGGAEHIATGHGFEIRWVFLQSPHIW